MNFSRVIFGGPWSVRAIKMLLATGAIAVWFGFAFSALLAAFPLLLGSLGTWVLYARRKRYANS